jgi:hypothetical protein
MLARVSKSMALFLVVACGGSKSTSPVATVTNPPPPDAGAAAATPDAGEPDATPARLNDGDAAAASRAFLELLNGSRLKIQRCYEHALKADTALQSQAITLTLAARFTDGKNVTLTTTPALGAPFESCLAAIAAGWQLAAPMAITFKAQVSLTPTPTPTP